MKVKINAGGLPAMLLTILFVALKLTDVIQWHWLWVVSPIWISLILAAIILLSVVLFKKFK